MDFLLGVEIDNRRIAWILDSVNLPASAVRLTTVSENQQKAILHFFIKYSKKKELLFTETLTGLPHMNEGKPSIDIASKISGKSLNYKIYVNGKPVRNGTHSLKKYMRNRKLLIIAIIAAGLLVKAAILFFLLAPLFNQRPAGEDEMRQKEISAPAENDTAVAERQTTADEQKATEGIAPPQESEPVFIESEIADKHSVYFNPDSSELTTDAISSLRDFINELPRRGDFTEGEFKIEVRGHCARYGTEEGRAELSRERAVNVYNFLDSEWGIKADSLVTGVGATEPLTLKRDEQYLNRRVDINIKGNITREQNKE